MRRKNWKNYSVDELEKLLPVSERWENQNLSNDFMFGKVMSDKKACAGVLNIILPEIETGEIIFTEIQKPLRDSIDSRGVRFDVYTKSDNGKRYDIEIQTTDSRDLFRRTRAYHAVLDSDILLKKETKRYSDMPDAFVIFICTFDPFKLGRHVYTFRSLCCEDKTLELGDGTSTIFLNTYGKDESVNADMKNLLNFIIGITCEDPFIKYLEGLLN
ncbi:MAG: Rpn family recombination-promoting nuclease/putative transposase, partial [Synergistaceae bacterium]|nr:Rpn family recombination-promoting nuclease/putative transposase [Synergistaceae bacterium]